MKKNNAFRLLVVFFILSLVLAACGAADESDSDLGSLPDDSAVDAQPAEIVQPTEMPQPTEQSASEAAAPDGAVFDLGFRPAENGFSFSNYGDDLEVTNLTEAELRRMFGDQVCARLEGDQCTLTPPAQQWMEQLNGDMAGGHCEGMAALSLLMYTDQVSEADFGGAQASQLDINDPGLQREIAYWWATQAVDPTYASVIKGTPVEILQTVEKMQATGETYTLGIYKEDGSGGHAITPFGVQDKGDGLFAILVYDNNYPGETRELLVDTRDNSWVYEASINPQVESELYTGNADTMTLDLTPTSARLGRQQCPFCEGSTALLAGGKLADAAQQFNQVFLDGEGHLLITDDDGHRLGYVDGKLVNEIPGAQYSLYRMGEGLNAPEPLYWLPAGLNVTITIDGSTLTEESVTDLVMIGSGFSIGVEGISLAPGQVDSAYFYPADEMISYETSADESPNIVLGVERPGSAADYSFEAQGTDMVGGGTLTLSLDSKAGDLLINTEKLNNPGSFDFYMTRITDDLEDEFSAEQIALQEGALVYINYAEWNSANPTGIYFGVDLNGDGTIDDEYVVDDSQ
jgi:hypothetical protein